MTPKAAFQIKNFLFNKVYIDIDNQTKDIRVEIDPSGVFISSNSTFELTFKFTAFGEKGKESPFVMIECKGLFEFENVNTLEEIPDFFYRNAMAILFPYLRAYISTVTIQANIAPVILPTYNLSDLEKPLIKNTTSK